MSCSAPQERPCGCMCREPGAWSLPADTRTRSGRTRSRRCLSQRSPPSFSALSPLLHCHVAANTQAWVPQPRGQPLVKRAESSVSLSLCSPLYVPLFCSFSLSRSLSLSNSDTQATEMCLLACPPPAGALTGPGSCCCCLRSRTRSSHLLSNLSACLR